MDPSTPPHIREWNVLVTYRLNFSYFYFPFLQYALRNVVTPTTRCPPKQNFFNWSVLLEVLKTKEIRKGTVFKIQIHFLSSLSTQSSCQLSVCLSQPTPDSVCILFPSIFIYFRDQFVFVWNKPDFPEHNPTDDIVYMWSEPITFRWWASSLLVTIYTAVHVPFFFPSYPPFLCHHIVGESISDSEQPAQPSATRGTANGRWTAIHNTKAPTASDNSGSTVETLSVIKLQYINRYDADVYRRKAPGCRAPATYWWTKNDA